MSTTEQQALGSSSDAMEMPRTRTSSAWTASAIGALLVLLMLIFVLQNTDKVHMSFLWMHFSVPFGAGLLLAAVIGALTVVMLGFGRIVQMRLAARRHRRADHHRPAISASN